MFTFIKWIVAALFTVFLWLIGKYTAEYLAFSPYRKYKLPEYD